MEDGTFITKYDSEERFLEVLKNVDEGDNREIIESLAIINEDLNKKENSWKKKKTKKGEDIPEVFGNKSLPQQ